jgi:hypothetical protein
MWRFEAKALSWAVIEVIHYGVNVTVRDLIEGHFLGEELADQAIHVFIGPALP